jgi:hypothetical protein
MKTLFVGFLVLLCSAQAFPQPGVPRNVESALFRIERAIREGYPASVEDLIQSGITMRLDDSLYQSISSITAKDLLNKYFADKDSIDFRFGLPGQGTMTYLSAGKRESTQVDVYLRRDHGEIGMYALNISNYPVATMFLNVHPDKNKTGK